MGAEAILSASHERRLRARGAREPSGDVYRLMAWVYPGSFLIMALEGTWRQQRVDAWFFLGLALWTASKGLKYAAIGALGERWCFRVLVVGGLPLVRRGPYRVLRHPNYAAVLGELAAMAFLCPAPVTGALSLAAFGALLVRRIRLEEHALGLRGR
jgi:methyltransferase